MTMTVEWTQEQKDFEDASLRLLCAADALRQALMRDTDYYNDPDWIAKWVDCARNALQVIQSRADLLRERGRR